MPAYVLPQVLVFQEFAAAPAALAAPLRATIVGPHYQLKRYPEERTALGAYDPTSEECIAWPGRDPGGSIDQTYTKVFFENALLQYFHDPAGDSSVITWVSPGKNRIRAQSKIFQTANGFARSTELLRDVRAGDVVKLLASGCGSPVTLEANVTGLIADTLAAIVGAATADVDNHPATTAATSSAQTTGPINNVGIDTLDGALYDGMADGEPNDVYTVEVIAGSTGGDATSALLKVTSASGKDDVSEVTPAAFGGWTIIGARGLRAKFIKTTGSSSSGPSPVDPDDFILGQKWTISVSMNFTPVVPASGGSYTGDSDTTYLVSVTRGGTFAGTVKPQVTVSTTTGVDISGPTEVTASGLAVAIGTRGTTIAFVGAGLNKNDRYSVVVTAAHAGPVRTLVLDRNLPDALRGVCGSSSSSSSSSGAGAPDLDVKIYIKKNIEVSKNRTGFAPLTNWEQSATQICLQAGIIAYDAEWQSGGILQALPVMAADMFVHYRALLPNYSYTVGTISDISQVEVVFGTLSPDNPLGFAVLKALENNNGEEVKYLSVYNGPEDPEAWLAALDVLVGRDDVYSLVPLTQEKAILDLFLAHVNQQSTPENGRWRIVWMNLAAEETIGIYTASAVTPSSPVLATIKEDPDTAGTQYILVEATGEKFVTNGVRPGDTLRALYTSDGFGNLTYSEYLVDVVLNEETIRLVSGPAAPVNIPSKIEIWRTLTKTELSAEMAAKPGLFSSRRAYLVWPDQIGNAGETFPGYFLCAALAGLRSGVLPHQGLTNIAINGFDDLSRTLDFFNASQLNTMAGSGYWIVTQDPSDGTVFTRHQLSTGDQTSLFEKEQSITTNMDSISYTCLNTMKAYIGKGNVTPTMLDIIRGALLGIIAQYKNTIIIDRLGPQLIEAVITQLSADPLLRDRVIARINITMPFPLNNLEIHLIAS